MKDCLFCNIIDKKNQANIIFEDEYTIAFLDISPISAGHTLVIPKKHHIDFINCDEESIANVAKTKKYIANLIKERLHPIGFNFLSNNGADAYQRVFHYHEHIIPKYIPNKGFIISKDSDESDKKPLLDIFNILK